jgi:hypothetical protein
MSWFWLDIPPVVLVCCWAGIRLWRVLARRDAEFKAEHAGVAAQAVAVPVLLQPAPAAAYGADHLACAGGAERSGQGTPGFALRRLSGASAYRSGFSAGRHARYRCPLPAKAWILARGYEDPARIAAASGNGVASV